MKKLLTLSIIGFFTLSSFGVKQNFEISKNVDNVELQTWRYKCCNGRTGTYLMPVGTSHADSLVVAQNICGC